MGGALLRTASSDAGGEEIEFSGGTTPVGRTTKRERVWRVAILEEGWQSGSFGLLQKEREMKGVKMVHKRQGAIFGLVSKRGGCGRPLSIGKRRLAAVGLILREESLRLKVEDERQGALLLWFPLVLAPGRESKGYGF
ncbi:hypothetical protein H0E87_002135 [Populus deltoides]|uniref:Uncharacterized protein n=1 Tax=Populus deltoides TaxID=3696 RepID=A0A8T2ZUG9_POPDE|nr:hypothetical protein H0E87_002135 [Populus deltoides]